MKIAFQDEIHKIQVEIEEQTFQRISEEIHDNIGQVLSLAKLNLHTLQLEKGHPALKQIETVNELVSKAISDLRQLSKSLNSAQLSQYSLFQCIQLELETIKKTGLYKTELEEEGEEYTFSPEKQLILFRMIQEVLTNIIKHAKAQKILVLIHYLPDKFQLKIKDDGIGFDLGSTENQNLLGRGSGIGNILRRSKLLNAEVNFSSPENQEGTLFQLTMPYE